MSLTNLKSLLRLERTYPPTISLVLIGILMVASTWAFADDTTDGGPTIRGPYVSEPVEPRESGPVTELPTIVPGGPIRVIPEGGVDESRPISPAPPSGLGDSVLQDEDSEDSGEAALSLVGPLLVKSGMTSFAAPPDTVGAVGKNHFIQMVNATTFQIFDKQGNALTGVLNFGGLWGSAPCNTNIGDPIIIYDHFADRWILSQFADGGYECIAVSKGANPVTSNWWLYQFQVESSGLPDYPKLAIASVGTSNPSYTMTTYLGSSLGIYGFDRAKMLDGQSATFIRFTLAQLTPQTGVRDTRILPVDLQGPARTDSWAYFMRSVDNRQDTADNRDRLELWYAIFNFATPASSSFSKITDIDDTKGLAGFDTLSCNRNGGGLRDCIPQPGTTQTVDALSNRPMMQAQLRWVPSNSGSLGNSMYVLTFNQTIDVRSSFGATQDVAAVRWYELFSDNFGVSWRIGQQGTYAPQPYSGLGVTALIHRWMGSAALDKRGNLAVGYSVSNNNTTVPVKPGLRVAGRHAADLPGRLGAEKVLFEGGNIQTDGTLRWGDYSAMTVDPDGCTFWFTGHIAPPGAGGRPTYFGTFRFPDCWANLGYMTGGNWKLDTGGGFEDGCGTDGCLGSFGQSGDTPVVGDWDGTGWPRIGVFRPSTQVWYLDLNGDGQWSGCSFDGCVQFGPSGSRAVVGDWNGDGRTKIGVYVPSTALWYLDFDGSLSWNAAVDKILGPFGLSSDLPVAGSWNGGLTARIGVFRPSTSMFYVDTNGSGSWDGCPNECQGPFGAAGDIPVIGDWIGQGRDRIGVFRPASGSWFLNTGPTNAWANCDAEWCLGPFGSASTVPVSLGRYH